MKTLFKAIAVILLGGLGAAGVVYLDAHCPKKQAAIAEKTSAAVQNYVQEHSEEIASLVVKSETFKNATKNLTSTQEEKVENEEENSQNKLFQENWDKITVNTVAPSVGPDDAKIVVAEFFDFACGHCKAFAPVLAQVVKNNPDVKFVFNPLYFLSEHSPYAAKVAVAAAKKGKFLAVYEGIMGLPELNEETINQILTDEGLDVDEIKKMIEEKEIRRGVQDIDALSQVLEINGVPMVIVNGEAVSGNELQNKINSLK
jgi:protein-disulfide isomerase